MPNGSVHAALGAATACAITAFDKQEVVHPLVNPITAIPAGMVLGRVPDMLEPAINPNHRKFFHSLLMLGLVCYGAKKLYDWEPNEDWQKLVRGALLIAGGSYAVHLLADGMTPKSLPVI